MMVYPNCDVYRTNEQFLRSGFDSGLHYVRHALMMLWVDFHRTGSATDAVELLRSRVAPLKDIYALSKRNVCRSVFDMEYGLAAALTADTTTIDTFLAHAIAYDPSSDAYGFYTGFVGVIKGLLTGNREMIQEQRKGIEKFNTTKVFYWPTKAVIFATLDGDYTKLALNVSKIEKRFVGYATKMEAVDADGDIDLHKLDLHFFCPYPDLAFYAMAFRNCPGFMKKDSFWLPKALVDVCGQALANRTTK